MSSDKELTAKVYTEYAQYLTRHGIRFNNNQNGFHVYIDLKNIKQSFTHVCQVFHGKILITDYCGNCYTGVRAANRVAKAIREKCPGHDIRVERYGGSFEIEIYHEIEFTTIDELHEHVLGVAAATDEGARIGYEMLGEDFER